MTYKLSSSIVETKKNVDESPNDLKLRNDFLNLLNKELERYNEKLVSSEKEFRRTPDDYRAEYYHFFKTDSDQIKAVILEIKKLIDAYNLDSDEIELRNFFADSAGIPLIN